MATTVAEYACSINYRKAGRGQVAMARKPATALELKSLPGQRSISSMLSTSRVTARASGNGRPIALMDFLDRKSEKRGALQGYVVDAGLTLPVRERLDGIHKNDTRSTKQDEEGDSIGQVLVDECNTSCFREAFPAGKRLRRPQVHAELGDRMQEKLITANILDRSRTRVNAAPRSPGSELESSEGRHDWERHLQKNATESCTMDFIDSTEDEDPSQKGFDGEFSSHEESSQSYRKRQRSQAKEATTEICPVCNDFFPREMLQAHVDSELNALELLDRESVSQAQGNAGVKNGSFDASGDQGRFSECSVQFKEPGINTKPRQSLLVLGDEPRYRRQAHVRHKNNRPSPIFNHYADGGGWWDEGGVGVDAEAVGSASVWEGLGSMSFGGML